MIFLGKFFFLNLFTLSLFSPSLATDSNLGKVIFANILFRHGDRTPLEPYPNDPWKNESLWPVPFGQLTKLGTHEHLILGRWFRERYKNLLPQKYSYYDIYVRSTDVDRTLMSAEANLAGLYPPQGDQIWDKLKWMPIPVHTVPETEDNVLSGKKYCPRYNYELSELLKTPKFVKIVDENAKLFEYLTEKAGRRIDSLEHLEYLYNILFIEELYNRTLPKWTRSVYPDAMKPLADLSFAVAANTKILRRLKVGLLIKEMVDHMNLKSKKALVPDRVLWIYSAHDETIANFLMALDLFEPHCPPYAAAVLVELRESRGNQQKVVTISYKNSSGEPVLLTLPGCVERCPLEQFVELTRDIIPEDWEQECSITWESYGIKLSILTVLGTMISAIVLLIIVVLLIILFVFWHYQREHSQYYTPISTDPN